MAVVKQIAGPGPARRGVTVNDHIDLIQQSKVNDPSNPMLQVRLVAKGTNSPAYAAVFDNLESLKDANLTVSSIFTGVKTKKEAIEIFSRYAEVYGIEAAAENLRICMLKRRKDIGEQLQLGNAAVWSETNDAPAAANDVLADPVSPRLVGLSEAAFDLLWSVSDEVAPAVQSAPKRK